MPQAPGATGTSAVSHNTSLARDTTGPEAGGQSHLGTVSSGATGTTAPGLGDDRVATAKSTLTYSMTRLPQGHPTSSIMDPDSIGLVTDKEPESPSHSHYAGVPEGSAQTAASRAFNSSKSHGGTCVSY